MRALALNALAVVLLAACGHDVAVTKVDKDGDGSPNTEDCNDSRDDIYPGATELCDGEDNDCDGLAERPVCGADNSTYDSACELRNARVRFAYAGACVGGSCEERCRAYGRRVCGADGETYLTACHARCAATTVAHPGPCKPPPKSCFQVNDYRASTAVRRRLCQSAASVCLLDSLVTDPEENGCLWDERSAKCGCRPSETVCSASGTTCVGCCNDKLKQCLVAAEGEDTAVSACFEAWNKCRDVCTDLIKDEAKEDEVQVNSEIVLRGVQAGSFNPDAFVAALLDALGVPGLLPDDVLIVSIRRANSRGGGAASRRREAGGASDDDVYVDYAIVTPANETDAVVAALGDATDSGALQDSLQGGMPGASGSTTSGGSSPSVGPVGGSTSSSAGGAPVAAVAAGVAVGVLLVVLVVLLVVRKRRNSHSSVSDSPSGSRTDLEASTGTTVPMTPLANTYVSPSGAPHSYETPIKGDGPTYDFAASGHSA
jgi:hypothetical protein